jgi:NTE family protein
MVDMGLSADLVLEGGGVKGIALVGAVEVLEEHGYSFRRIAGTSAGAIVGALLAAEIPAKRLVEIMREVDYKKFQDGPFFSGSPRISGNPVVKAAAILTQNGAYRGEYLRTWLQELLQEQGKTTFAQMKYTDQQFAPEPAEAYKLMVTTSDLGNRCLRYLPWQYEAFGFDRDSQSVVDAVRASMSIPYFYRPVRWKTPDGRKQWLVDGGMLSNFPITAFDAQSNRTPRWPTFGIKLSGHPEDLQQQLPPIRGPVDLARAMVSTWTAFFDQVHIASPDAQARTIFVRTADIARATDFNLDEEQQDRLYERGREATEKFLDGWDFEQYIKDHRSPSE